MKFSHNKKRNTAVIYEILINELTKAVLHKKNNRKEVILVILKENFSKNTILNKEKNIYDSFSDLTGFTRIKLEKLLHEAKKQFNALDRKEVFDNQTKLINRINKSLSTDIWKSYIPTFKSLATVNQILQESLSPKEQVLLEEKFLDRAELNDKEERKLPKVNNLAMKTFIEKFNSEYSEKLNESQKQLLNKYIMSYMDNGLEFKALLYEEISRLSSELKNNLLVQEAPVKNRLEKILERISAYNQRKIDKNLILEIFQIQSLVKEIKNNANHH